MDAMRQQPSVPRLVAIRIVERPIRLNGQPMAQ